nr:hypothetical protein GCM10020092_026150 [Actinoplanes digitatis]
MTAGTGWTFDLFADFEGMLVVSQGLVPIGAAADLAACANGEKDRDWRNFGALMTRHGRGDSVVRLGWEFNERTSPWRADDPATWIACYRRAATNIRAGNPDVLLDWTINAHGTPAGVCGGVSTNCYPGDAYVDIVGIDNYDHYPWSPTKAAFDRVAAAPEGLDWLYRFARAHGKLFAVGEWGVVPTGDAGRENPSFVTWMHAWFAEPCQVPGVRDLLLRLRRGRGAVEPVPHGRRLLPQSAVGGGLQEPLRRIGLAACRDARWCWVVAASPASPGRSACCTASPSGASTSPRPTCSSAPRPARSWPPS